MNPESYTDEQKKDIQERVDKANALLTDLQLTPAVLMQMVNIGDDAFAAKPIPYLQDQKYQPIESPIQQEDL